MIAFSQVSVFEAKKTTDRAVVEKFIRDNPNHPAVPELKQRALSLKYAGNSQIAKPTITQMTEKRSKKHLPLGQLPQKASRLNRQKIQLQCLQIFLTTTQIKRSNHPVCKQSEMHSRYKNKWKKIL